MSDDQCDEAGGCGCDHGQEANVWQTRLAVARPEGGDGYAPASSLETVDAFLTSIGAGQPLDADAEKKALAASK